MRRREFITLLGVTAVGWPLAARAQQPEPMRRIGVLMAASTDDHKARLAAFQQSLQKLGWTEGRNVRVDIRWSVDDADALRKHAAELVAGAPDVIMTDGAPTLAALLQATRLVPIVFATVIDPVGNGFVETLSRPGGNVTGFMLFEFSLSGKWPDLLKQIAPRVVRVAVIRDPTASSGIAQFAVIQSVVPSIGMEVSVLSLLNVSEIERNVATFAQSSDGALILTASPLAYVRRDLIVTLAARHRLPAVYPDRSFVTAGGLISYGPDRLDQHRRAAAYVDRILKGEKPADLPVQAPTKYELVINVRTAKALGLTIPPTLLARADEVIE